MTETKLDAFTQAYIEAALWSSYDDNGDPLDDKHDIGDLAPETLARMVADCERFQVENEALITDENLVYQSEYGATERAGHDFWLTRNGHGAGFWDGDWAEPAAGLLDEAATKFGNVDLYVGDDGKIYGQ